MPSVDAVKAAASALPDESGCKCMPAWARYLSFIIAFFLGFALTSGAIGKYEDPTVFYVFWIIGVLGAWFSTLFIKSIKK